VAATPAATPLSTRSPEVPATLTEVPPVLAPTVIAPVPGEPPVCWTRPTVPLATPVARLVMAVVLLVTEAPRLFTVEPRLVTEAPRLVMAVVLAPTVVLRLLTVVPSAFTAWLVALSWEPFTASVLVAETRPAATLVIWRGAAAEPTLTTLVGLAPATV